MEKTISEARSAFLELYGGTLVANNHLRIALVCVSTALIFALMLAGAAIMWAKNQKPLVIRIDEVGRAAPVNYTAFDYRPEERELRYFLGQFVSLHFARLLPRVEERYSKSLYFVDRKLSQAMIEEERKSMAVAKFASGGGDEVDIVIKNIALQDLRSRPMKASVDFERIFLSRGDHRETGREQNAGYFEFVVQEKVPNWMVLVNPLGLTITYFRADTAFKK